MKLPLTFLTIYRSGINCYCHFDLYYTLYIILCQAKNSSKVAFLEFLNKSVSGPKHQTFSINILFGSILLYSYYRGINNNPGIGIKLWGGVPQIITPYIVTSMFISAIGYFFFTYYILFFVDNRSIKVFNVFNYTFFIITYLFILIPSCLWIDFSIFYINNPSNLLWIAICAILYTVGIFSILLLIGFYNIKGSVFMYKS